MPLYEYCCEACGRPEEKLESLTAPMMHACPACGVGDGMKRQLSVAAFSLSGGGVYKSAASEPVAPASPLAAAETPKSGPGCGAGACGCPLAK